MRKRGPAFLWASSCSTEASGSKFHDPARDPQAYRKQARSLGGSFGLQGLCRPPAWMLLSLPKEHVPLGWTPDFECLSPQHSAPTLLRAQNSKLAQNFSRGWADSELRQAASEFRARAGDGCFVRAKVKLESFYKMQCRCGALPGPDFAQVTKFFPLKSEGGRRSLFKPARNT